MAAVLVLAFAAAGCDSRAPDPSSAVPALAAPERIVLVTIDTLRADFVGSYGAQQAHTPNLDSLASRGLRFDIALSPVPLTLPAHATVMTGLDPPGHGVRHNSIHRLGPELPTLAEGLREAGYATAAFVGALVLDRRFGLARGFDVYDDRTGGRVSGSTGYAERPADAVVDAALAWLADAPARFFLWVHFYDPHAGYSPPPGFAAAFAKSPYAGEIAFVDAELGRLLDAIRTRFGEQGLAVLATSDHGESLGEHGEATHSYALYESTQRIPLLLAAPGIEAGQVAPGPASLADVAPTLLAMAGAEPLPQTEGRDLRELARATAPGERTIYMESLATQLDFGWSPLHAVRSGTWKYIRAAQPELYDLADDPAELRNRVESDPEPAQRLAALLDARVEDPARRPVSVSLPPEDRERLRSLGYVVPEGEHAPDASADAADPERQRWVLQQLALAQSELEQGKGAQALERLSGLDATSPTIAAHRAAAAMAAGELEIAERDARAALSAEPTRTDARLLLARVLAAQGREAEAGRALAALPPDFAPASWVALDAARGEVAAGRNDLALRRLSLARDRHPGDPELATAAAVLLEAEGRLEEALAAREAALAARPGDPRLENAVAWTLARLGRDLDRALQLAQSAVASDAEQAAFLDTLATLHLARAEHEQALAVVEQALPLARDETRTHLLELQEQARQLSTSR